MPRQFLPGDDVEVIDGTFVGRKSKVITSQQEVEQASPGGPLVPRLAGDSLLLLLTSFDRLVHVELQPYQIRHCNMQ